MQAEFKSNESRKEDTVLRAREGDVEAFAELYCTYYPRVLGVCLRLLSRREDAEDAAAEVFLKVQRALPGYDPALPFAAWLLRVASHHCVDRLRRRSLEGRLFAATDLTESLPEKSDGSPFFQALNGQREQRVREQVNRLPAHFRVPLVLRYYAEMSYKEIAEVLGVGRNTVATLIFRAKKDLRRKLEPEWLDVPSLPGSCWREYPALSGPAVEARAA